tara:strand:+ start:16 stop:288 length:273 start_codon:yes stop_codon:yes gene_type:complete
MEVRSALIAETKELEINKIYPNYRLEYEDEVLPRLCDDIKLRGLQEPAAIDLVEYWFQVVDGEKRWRAYKKNGWNTIKVIILEALTTAPT